MGPALSPVELHKEPLLTAALKNSLQHKHSVLFHEKSVNLMFLFESILLTTSFVMGSRILYLRYFFILKYQLSLYQFILQSYKLCEILFIFV